MGRGTGGKRGVCQGLGKATGCGKRCDRGWGWGQEGVRGVNGVGERGQGGVGGGDWGRGRKEFRLCGGVFGGKGQGGGDGG